jgi:hypothetical protein
MATGVKTSGMARWRCQVDARSGGDVLDRPRGHMVRSYVYGERRELPAGFHEFVDRSRTR